MPKNKTWVEGEPCKKCGHPVVIHKEYPKDHMYTYCFICWECKTTYFNKRLEVIRKKKEEKKLVRKTRATIIREKYFEPPLKGADDLIERIADVVANYENGRQVLSVILRLFIQHLRKRKDKWPHNFTQEEVLRIMRAMASHDLRGKYWRSLTTNQKLREQYNKKKFTENWKPHISARNCYVCDKKADIRHHIVPLKHGGHNSYLNIRSLCNACHAEIHDWLKH